MARSLNDAAGLQALSLLHVGDLSAARPYVTAGSMMSTGRQSKYIQNGSIVHNRSHNIAVESRIHLTHDCRLLAGTVDLQTLEC